MDKKFFEVFPGLIIHEEIREFIEDANITKIAVNHEKTALRIYMESKQWIHKQHIYTIEDSIREQLFPNQEITVKIIEKFNLSMQYTPQNFLDVYRESILLEMKRYSVLVYNLFYTAQISFSMPDTMHMVLAESVIAQDKTEELVGILEKIFCERCGMDFKVHIEYCQAGESKARRKSELKIQEEARHVLEKTAIGSKQKAQGEGSGEEVPTDDMAKDSHVSKVNKEDVSKANNKDTSKVNNGDASRTNNEDASRTNNGQMPKEKKTTGDRSKKQFFNRGKDDYRAKIRKSDNPDVLYGRDFEGEVIPIDSIAGEMGEVVIRGKILSLEAREIRNEKTILMFAVSDFTDTIMVKMFMRNDQVEEVTAGIKKGAFIKLKGVTTIDRYDHELSLASIVGVKKISSFVSSRMDASPEKRVELHCHSKMSDMDGVTDAATLVKRAHAWGHKAIAITDHGVVQAFPEANHAMEDIDRAYRDQYQKEHPKVTKDELKKIESPFKVIYGVEAYLVDDLKGMVENGKGQDLDSPFVVFDIETTGFSPHTNKIIEIGAVRVEQGKIVSRFSTFVNPQVPIPFKIESLTGINDNMVINADTIEVVLPKFLEFCQGAVLVAHNAGFDMSFIEKNCDNLGYPHEFTSVDTVGMARFLMPGLNRFKLNTVAKALGVALLSHHRAVDDASCTADIFVKFIQMLKERGIQDLDDLNEQGKVSVNTIKKLNTYHTIILATNETGRVNLYHLVSLSHLDYYNRRPRVAKSVYQKYSEGLIIGTACEAGELYQALLRGASDKEINRITEFYDYFEIQPIGNNAFMMRGDEPKTEEELKDINRKIVKLGEDFQKPVVATCDVHFIDPEDEVYRRIIMTGKGFSDADDQAPLYLRTTEEMLKEFEYLGEAKAEEVVITNTNKIADMCEKFSPIRAGKYAPVIENSDSTLREICYNCAHEIYGENLPGIVSARLERELNSIISNGYAVMYIIAQKLVWKSNEDGYLVGSRGSVGSSFAATMSGITEVNPLSPHYYCKECHYYDFDSPEVKEYSGRAGCDMPDKKCPKCGSDLKKEGFDIPFETFLGFKGNKEPDIDLNFSGDYQGKAHKYTEVIFGAGQTFRAGTIGTLADKTAFGYVKNYYEEHGVRKRNCEIDRIVQGCTGIRRTTGQHPGGIIVLPLGEDINSFTPVQHPANDVNTDIITTHFDYHSIDENLLKLDILGHDDPTMIRMLEDLTGLNAQTIPLDDQNVMSLFKSTEALGITPDDIGGCKLGCLGIPEFGTDFVIQMLLDTKPMTFSDLVRISGLSHGTDVWLGNAQTLIQEGKATIATAICTRDDIMTYLINMGVESELAFTIMESVRKGKGLKPDWEEEMLKHDVPDWYIWSCKKIKYMFPKAHAAAYVMMAFRIAYYKILHPLAYYAAYFSIRASAFSYELMCLGRERLEYHLKDFKNRGDSLSKKDQDTLKDMKIVQEMYARGFEFMPVDLFTAKAHHFQIIDGKLMPALDTIEGLGDKAADAVVLAAMDGKFLSKDDFRQRTKVSKTVIDLMDDLNIFGEIPDTNQFSIFDF